MKNRIYVGIVNENELYYLEIKKDNYFSICGNSVRVVNKEDGEEEARNYLGDGELWEMAVESDNTALGLNDWVDHVLDCDGWESQLDTDISISGFDYNNETYYFPWVAGGQHEEKEFDKLFIDQKLLDKIFKVWGKYHLKDVEIKDVLPELENFEQNENEILKSYIDFVYNS